MSDHEDGEDVVGVGGGEVRQPEEVGLAELDDLGHHGEEGEEQRELDERRDAAAEHADAVGLLDGHDLGVHLGGLGVGGLGVFVLGLDGVDLGLDALHLERGLHALDAQGQKHQVDHDGEDDDGPSPGVVVDAGVVRRDPGVDGAEAEEEVLADGAEEAEVEEGLEVAAVGGVDVLEDVDGLGADEDAGRGVAGGGADGGAEDGELLGGGRCALGVAGLDLGDVDLVLEGDDGGVVGLVGHEDGAEVLVAEAGEVEGAVEGGAAGDLLEGEVVGLAVGAGIDLRARVGGGGLHVAEAGGPGEQGADGSAVAEDLGVRVDDVGVGEGEGLGDGEIALGVLEGEGGGGLEGAGGGGDVEGGGELLVEAGVVGVEGERVAVELGGALMDEVQRMAGVVLVLLEDPGGDLAALVGEGDLVERVLDGGGAWAAATTAGVAAAGGSWRQRRGGCARSGAGWRRARRRRRDARGTRGWGCSGRASTGDRR